MPRVPQWFDSVDEIVERVAERARKTPLEPVSHLLSSTADRSLLWVAAAGARVARDRTAGPRVAARALVVVAAQSGVVHFGVKRLFRRDRPRHERTLRFGARRPPSSSFPSGHAASAATAAILLAEGDPAGPALVGLALAVAWSRVQTGLHHATDVVGGLILGSLTAAAIRRRWPLAPPR